jgi:hypothetical protein
MHAEYKSENIVSLKRFSLYDVYYFVILKQSFIYTRNLN